MDSLAGRTGLLDWDTWLLSLAPQMGSRARLGWVGLGQRDRD
uniref:Uncharacterized protein n=1 Tax=Picea glauca TaxID=3330 RepID=A0A101M4Q0_PICGL|nr:hypothetical protein ABT39_MTgene676 [Picea glauca]QHR90920.1 hypothetical protein Q903MT_gene4949 [Picea sitchensis]